MIIANLQWMAVVIFLSTFVGDFDERVVLIGEFVETIGGGIAWFDRGNDHASVAFIEMVHKIGELDDVDGCT